MIDMLIAKKLGADEKRRQENTLSLIAAENILPKRLQKLFSYMVSNKTTEGISRHRYHGGSAVIDKIELEAISHAKLLFKAKYANVQPHSCTQANQAVIFSFLSPQDRVLSMDLFSGGHISHGKPSIISKLFEVYNYGVDDRTELLDYGSIMKVAERIQPKLMICGASSYPRLIDYVKMREIADNVGAYLLADISHISGMIAAGLIPSPIDHAHFTTSSTYKTLRGPRGAIILSGKDYSFMPKGKNKTISEEVNHMVCPGIQSAIHSGAILMKLACFEEALTEDFISYQKNILAYAKVLEKCFKGFGYDLYTGGTDTHMIIIDLRESELNGYICEKALERCGIITNRNLVPNDKRKPHITSGLRIGVPSLVSRGFSEQDIEKVCVLINKIISSICVKSDTEYSIQKDVISYSLDKVKALVLKYPIDE